MDPDIALRQLVDAVESGDIDRVEELATAIEGWLSHGGFPPITFGRRSLGSVWHVAVTKAVLRLAKAHVQIVAARAGEV